MLICFIPVLHRGPRTSWGPPPMPQPLLSRPHNFHVILRRLHVKECEGSLVVPGLYPNCHHTTDRTTKSQRSHVAGDAVRGEDPTCLTGLCADGQLCRPSPFPPTPSFGKENSGPCIKLQLFRGSAEQVWSLKTPVFVFGYTQQMSLSPQTDVSFSCPEKIIGCPGHAVKSHSTGLKFQFPTLQAASDPSPQHKAGGLKLLNF